MKYTLRKIELMILVLSCLILGFTVVRCKKEPPAVHNKKVNTVTAPASTSTSTPTVTPLIRVFLGTITPLPYYPVYPGSWWKYEIITSQGKTTSTSKATGYFLDSIDVGSERRVAFVPNDGFYYMWGYNRRNYCVTYRSDWPNTTTTCLVPLLSENLGNSWLTEYSLSSRTPTFDHVFVVDTSITISGHTFNNVIGVKSQVHANVGLITQWVNYYAKDVGLILNIMKLRYPADTSKLVDYHIEL
jgi:hypothetical protein